jgi:hypothetical protein
MTTATQDALASAADARTAVDQAEADLVSGKRSISADALHKLRARWRHADLTAERTRRAAEQERREARLTGLAAIGAEVDKLAQPEHTERLAEALRDVAAAVAKFRNLAAAHDADVADLVAAATDLKAEPEAPSGPRGTSSYIAVKGTAIIHRRTTITALGSRVHAAVGHAVSGDIDRAIAEVRAATTVPEPRRPDYLLRNVRSGMIVPIHGPLNDGMAAQLKRNNPLSGTLEELSAHDVDRWMRGEFG